MSPNHIMSTMKYNLMVMTQSYYDRSENNMVTMPQYHDYLRILTSVIINLLHDYLIIVWLNPFFSKWDILHPQFRESRVHIISYKNFNTGTISIDPFDTPKYIVDMNLQQQFKMYHKDIMYTATTYAVFFTICLQ